MSIQFQIWQFPSKQILNRNRALRHLREALQAGVDLEGLGYRDAARLAEQILPQAEGEKSTKSIRQPRRQHSMLSSTESDFTSDSKPEPDPDPNAMQDTNTTACDVMGVYGVRPFEGALGRKLGVGRAAG